MSHCRAPAPALPAHGGGGGAALHRGGSGTTLSLTLALSLTPLTQGSSLWLPPCLHHRLSCSALLPQTLPCSILLPQTLPRSTLLPLIAEGWGGTSALPILWPPCSPPTPLTQNSSLWLPPCLHHRLSCSALLPQTLPRSTLLPLIAEGWGGTSALPILWPPCSPPTPLTQNSSLWLPPCLHHRKSCSALLPQTLPCSTLLPLVAEGWGGTSALPIPKPPCSPLLLAGWRWVTL